MSEDMSCHCSSSSSSANASARQMVKRRNGGVVSGDDDNDATNDEDTSKAAEADKTKQETANANEPSTKNCAESECKRRRRFSACQDDHDDNKVIVTQQPGNGDCDNSSSLQSIIVGTGTSSSSLTNSASTTIEEMELELDDDDDDEGAATATPSSPTASSNKNDKKMKSNLKIKTTEAGLAAGGSVDNENASNALTPVAVAAADDGNNSTTNTAATAAPTEHNSETLEGSLYRRLSNIRRRHYRRCGQSVSLLSSSDSSENSFNANRVDGGGGGGGDDGANAAGTDDVGSGDAGASAAAAQAVNNAASMNENTESLDSNMFGSHGGDDGNDGDDVDNENANGVDERVVSLTTSADSDSSDTSFQNDDSDDDEPGGRGGVAGDGGVGDDDYDGLPRFLSRRRAPSGRGILLHCPEQNEPTPNTVKCEVDAVLAKPLPTASWNTLIEVQQREHGLANRFTGSSIIGNSCFNRRFYASPFVVQHMKRSHRLRKHRGCVNSLNFNRSGSLLCSGSDDRRIVVWDWAKNKPRHTFASGHRENIFQTKFVSSGAGIDIISAGRDGQVRRSMVSSSGKVISHCLYKHRDAVHKLVICPSSQFELLSAGEDGHIRHCDLREEPSLTNSLIQVRQQRSTQAKSSQTGGSGGGGRGTGSGNTVLLFGITHHPYAPEVAVCGSDEYVRVYDKRKFNAPVRMFRPAGIINENRSRFEYVQVTCCTYNHDGSEILATYSDEKIFLFDNKTNNEDGAFLHSYWGHYNHRTIKGVNFFGPNSEFIVSGSDCGNIFFWDKETEAILNFMPGDDGGVVNCLEPHPTFPVLAASGLDVDVKIYVPSSQNTVPSRQKLKDSIARNIKRSKSKVGIQILDRDLNDFILETMRTNNLRTRNGAAADDSDDDDDDDDDDDSDVAFLGTSGFSPFHSSSRSSESDNHSDEIGVNSIFDMDENRDDDDSSDGGGTGNIDGLTCSTQ